MLRLFSKTRIFLPLILASAAFIVHADDVPTNKTTTATYQDWLSSCVESDVGQRCEIKQNLVGNEGKLVSVMSLVKPRSNMPAIVQIALPHMLDLSVPVKLSVDGNALSNLGYRYCNAAACFVIIENREEIIAAFKEGVQVQFELLAMNRQPIKLSFSLKGFTAALNNLMPLQQAQ